MAYNKNEINKRYQKTQVHFSELKDYVIQIKDQVELLNTIKKALAINLSELKSCIQTNMLQILHCFAQLVKIVHHKYFNIF